MILFCLPYAGGSEAIYYKWKNYLNSDIQLEPIKLKGRGQRYNENFYENLEEAVDDIFEYIKYKIVDNEYAILGYSMGSLLAYELYYKIVRENLRIPEHMFFMAHKAPNINKKNNNIHLLPNDKFIKKIIELGGTPNEVFENKELLELVLPILRNDFKIIENYVFKDKKEKIECNISVFNGKEDDIDLTELLAWKELGNKECKIYNFDGGHFFINNNIKKIINILNETLIN